MHETSRNVAKKKKNRLSYALERVVRCHLAKLYTYHMTLNIIMIGSLGYTMYCELCFQSSKLNPESLVEAALKFHWFHSRGVLSHEQSLHYGISSPALQPRAR